VPLADIVSVVRRSGFSTVRRENGIRLVSVTGDISEDNPADAQDVMSSLEAEILPEIAGLRQVEWRLSGLAEQEEQFLNDARTGLILCLTGIYLVLTWIFSSWTRPIVVMSIIPFGLVGTIYGHYVWDVPLSMFSVVGLLGMTGIIINDSIVLITSIDEYAKDRGLIPSVIDGAADRLRPVMLTTLTTVLGLSPLLYERSSQAQFLKPTVITLVYGLGFGMVLVLLVVPALIAVQHDVKRHFGSLWRGISGRALGLKRALQGLTALIVVWFGLTMGATFQGQKLPAFIPDTPQFLYELPPMLGALLLFLCGTILLITVAFFASYLRGNRRRSSV
jgi:multidrug efflux pump subunit AcrB